MKNWNVPTLSFLYQVKKNVNPVRPYPRIFYTLTHHKIILKPAVPWGYIICYEIGTKYLIDYI